MIANALKRSDGNINYPGLIAAWPAKGKTNDDADKAILKDLTGNGHDITLNGFSFSEMSGYGGYKTNMLNWKYNKNSAVILSSQNKFIAYNTLEIATHFWDYVSSPPLGTIHRPSFKLKISGLNEDEAIYYTYRDGEDFSVPHEGNLYNGINIFPEINAEIVTEKLPYTTIFEIQSQRIVNKEITFEILPEYPGALVFDGVDDYGHCDMINANLFKENFTFICRREYISEPSSVHKMTTASCKAVNTEYNIFTIEGFYQNPYISVYSTGSLTYDKAPVDYSLNTVFLTPTNYNGHTFEHGGNNNHEDNSKIIIGNIFMGDRYANMAFYSAYLFDRSLDEQEIKSFIRKYIDPEYLLPSEILTPDCYYDFSQGSNDDENRDTIKDYSGNGNDAVAHNFAWSGMSGYGGHNCYFSSNSGVNRYEGSFTKDKAHITKIINEVNKNLINIYIINNFNIKISGLTGNNLVRIGPPNVATLSLSNGTHKIDSSLFPKGYSYSIGILGDIGECDITIEILPEYPGALVFDGVDDYISLDAFDSGFKTMFMVCNQRNKSNAFLYDQRKNTKPPYDYGLYTYNSVAYNMRNANDTYINGIKNTKVFTKDLNNKKILISVNSKLTQLNKPTISVGITGSYSDMALYKFLGFKKALTEEQIQTVIKKYNLLDGVDEIEVS
jgi:hypothetical protein